MNCARMMVDSPRIIVSSFISDNLPKLTKQLVMKLFETTHSSTIECPAIYESKKLQLVFTRRTMKTNHKLEFYFSFFGPLE